MDDFKNALTLRAEQRQAEDRKRELDIKERDVAAKEREVSAKEKELDRSRWLNPAVIGLFASALALIGNLIVGRINNSNTQEAQRLQSEANITLEAIKTGTGKTDEACRNLTLFVSLGLIRDPYGRIGNQCQNVPAGPPSLPAGQGAIQSSVRFDGDIVDESGKHPKFATLTIEREDHFFVSKIVLDGKVHLDFPPEFQPGNVVTLQVIAPGYKFHSSKLVLHESDTLQITLHRVKN